MACLWISDLLGLPCNKVIGDVNVNLSEAQKECISKVEAEKTTRFNFYEIWQDQPFKSNKNQRENHQRNMLWLLQKMDLVYYGVMMQTKTFNKYFDDIERKSGGYYHFKKCRQRIYCGRSIITDEVAESIMSQSPKIRASKKRIKNISTLQQLSYKNNMKLL